MSKEVDGFDQRSQGFFQAATFSEDDNVVAQQIADVDERVELFGDLNGLRDELACLQRSIKLDQTARHAIHSPDLAHRSKDVVLERGIAELVAAAQSRAVVALKIVNIDQIEINADNSIDLTERGEIGPGLL